VSKESTRTRIFLAVVAGYLIFAVSAVLLFQLTNVDPHSPAALGFEGLTIAYGFAFAFLSGFVAGRIGRRTDLRCGIALALVIALGATISMIARPGAGALWTQTAALILFAPASLAGDWTRRRMRATAS
jgi:MFS family permease